MSEYCLGLKKERTRQIEAEESAYVSRHFAVASSRRRLWVAGSWLCPVLFVGCLIGASSGPVFEVACFVIMLVCLPTLLVLARDSKKRVALLEVAVTETEVEEFRSENAWIARLPKSMMIIGGSEGMPKAVTTVETSTVGSRRKVDDQFFPPEIEVWDDQTSELRQLSPQESAELQSLTMRWTPKVKWYHWLLLAYFSVGGIASLVTRGKDQAWVVRGVIYSLVAAHSGYSILRVTRDRKAFMRDLERNVVARVDAHGNRWEVLPESGLIWTEDGEPTPPRTNSQAPTRV